MKEQVGSRNTQQPSVVSSVSFPELMKSWRKRRRMSQLELGLEAGVSQRHVSFLESGRAKPSRTMILQLSETLSVPLRERNDWLLAAGFAPIFAARPLDDPQMTQVMAVGGQEMKTMLIDLASFQDVELLVATEETALLPILPLALEKDGLHLSLFTVIATFGTAQDITADELRIESLFPADEATERLFRTWTVESRRQ